jgi:hypothetical protein
MRQRPWARLVAAVAGGVGLALAAPMLAAVGQVSPPAPVLTIGPTARLVAQGAAVAVPVRVVVTCPEGATASVNVQVVQAVGRDVAHAFGDTTDIVCDGTPQTVEVFATSSDFRFFPGPAFVTARLFACSFPGPGPFPGSSCTATAQREVQIVGDFGPLPTLPPPPTTFPPPPTTFPPPPTSIPLPTIPGFPLPDITSIINLILSLFGGFGGAV